MAFNKITLTKVGAQSVNQRTFEFVDGAVGSGIGNYGNDIFYHLGSNLDRFNNSWSNPYTAGTYFTTTSNISISNLENMWARTGSIVSATTAVINDPVQITIEFLTGFEVNLNLFRQKFNYSSTSFQIKTIKIEGSNDNVNFKQLLRKSDFPNPSSGTYVSYYLPSNEADWYKYIRITYNNSTTTTNHWGPIEFYGKLRNLTTGVAGFTTPGDRFSNLLNVDIDSNLLDRIVYYDATSNLWEARTIHPYTVNKLVMTEDLVISSDDIRSPQYYVLSPNGANRNVYLPAPTKDDTIKFRSLDGIYNINIRELDQSQLTVNLAHYWKLDVLSSPDEIGTATQLEGSGNSLVPGIINNQYNLSGSVARAGGTQAPVGSFSIACWVEFDVLSGTQSILSKWSNTSGNKVFELQIIDNKVYWTTSIDGLTGVNLISNESMTVGIPYYIVATYNEVSGETQLYINNTLDNKGTQNPGGLHSYNAVFFSVGSRVGLGDFNNHTNFLDGKVDEVGWWNRILTPSEISLLYNSGSGLSYDTFSSATPPTPVVLSSAGKLEYEYVYDGTEFQVLG